MATPPRIVTPGRRVHMIVRAVNRQHRFVPVKEVVRSIEFVFWHYAKVHGIQVHEMTWMSNHAHCILTDTRGVLPKFACQMNSMLSRQLNSLRRINGTNIEKGYCDIEILDDETMVGYCAYTLANPCKAGLVARASAWKGVTSYHLEYGKSFVVKRPSCGLWAGKQSDDCELPDEVVVSLARPPVMPELSDEDLRAHIRLETAVKERVAEAERMRLGRRVVGFRRVTAVKYYESPSTIEEIRSSRKRVSGRDAADELYHRKRICAFNQSYQAALKSFVEHDDEPLAFPYGTWLMKETYRRACECAPAPS